MHRIHIKLATIPDDLLVSQRLVSFNNKLRIESQRKFMKISNTLEVSNSNINWQGGGATRVMRGEEVVRSL